MPELLRSAKLAVEKGRSQGRNESYIKQLSDYIVPALVDALHKVSLLGGQVFCSLIFLTISTLSFYYYIFIFMTYLGNLWSAGA